MATPSQVIPRKRPAETQEEAWVAEEDRFVLKQAKKRSALRVKSGRGRPIDLLVVSLRPIDASPNDYDPDDEDDEAFAVMPDKVFEDLDAAQLRELGKEIDVYCDLEQLRPNREFWQTMKTVCNDRIMNATNDAPNGAGLSVTKELDGVLEPKTLDELEALEKQVREKLRVDAAIDVDYWEGLLNRLTVFKATAKLRKVSQDIIAARTRKAKDEQKPMAEALQTRLAKSSSGSDQPGRAVDITTLDPEPSLKISAEHKSLSMLQETLFLKILDEERRRLQLLGPALRKSWSLATSDGTGKPGLPGTASAYDREVARGMGENEEVFTTEEAVIVLNTPAWADQYKPRKPRYFNRIQLGYEWNKYNQTHYDQDNPPPKVVQGYRFNIFYPDLVDRTKTPTFRIIREDGRRRGQTAAPAGQNDSCVIRFMAGAPYEDIAFRIVDREWELSAKRERGYRSSFEKVA